MKCLDCGQEYKGRTDGGNCPSCGAPGGWESYIDIAPPTEEPEKVIEQVIIEEAKDAPKKR